MRSSYYRVNKTQTQDKTGKTKRVPSRVGLIQKILTRTFSFPESMLTKLRNSLTFSSPSFIQWREKKYTGAIFSWARMF